MRRDPRPRDRSWTAAAQAALFAKTLHELGITRPIVVGHSWGTLVALSLALAHPQLLSGLVLASGYYFPTARADVALLSPPSLPIVGDLLTHTIAPLIGEALGPGMIKKMFAPQLVSQRFAREFPMALTLRPSQVKAFSEDTSHMINAAGKICGSYAALRCPTVIMAGDADGIVDVDRQARRLHGAVPGSRIDILRGAGHMVHHLDPGRMIRAIDLIASGGITRESVEAEAAIWGIPA